MFEKLFISQKHLENKKKTAKKRFSEQNPTQGSFTAEEEAKFVKMNKPLMNKVLKIYRGECNHYQIADIVKDFKKANYNINNFDKKYTKKMDEMYEFLSKCYEKNKSKFENTSVEVYLDAYKILHDSKVRGTVQKVSKNFDKMFQGGKVDYKNVLEEARFAYTSGCIICALYLALLIFCILYLAIALVVIIIEIDDFAYNTKQDYSFFDFNIAKLDKDYAAFTLNVAYSAAEFIEFFNTVSLSKMENASTKIVKKLGTESIYEGSKYASLDINVSTVNKKQLEDLKFQHGQEDFGIILAIGAGIILFMILLFPAIRAFLYYIESLKVDLSDFYNEEAELLDNNIAKLEEKMEAAKSPAEKAKYKSIIEKQKAYREKMKQKADKFYIAERDTEKIAEAEYTADEQRYQDEDTASSEPTIII